MNEDTDAILLGGVIVVVVLAIASFWFAFFRLDHTKTLSVRDKEWYREIRELEDYRVWECHNSSKYDALNDKRETVRECGWETRTRTHNVWKTGGKFPSDPFWWQDYKIGEGHYERRYESYTIYLSDDKRVLPYSTGDKNYYDTFKLRSKCEVGMSLVDSIVSVGGCK